MLQLNVGAHVWKYPVDLGSLALNSPVKVLALEYAPPLRAQYHFVESSDRTLKESSHPTLVAVGEGQDTIPRFLVRERKIKGKFGSGYHQAVIGVVASEAIGGHRCPCRWSAAYPERLHDFNEGPAAACGILIRCEARYPLKGRADKPIAWGVNREFLEPASYSTVREELPALRREEVNTPTDTMGHVVPWLIPHT